jgi:hypothetical protein
MKSRIVKKEDKQLEFPCLMILDNLIVLFTEHNKGTVVGGGTSLGHYSDEWDMDAFKPFHETVELSN